MKKYVSTNSDRTERIKRGSLSSFSYLFAVLITATAVFSLHGCSTGKTDGDPLTEISDTESAAVSESTEAETSVSASTAFEPTGTATSCTSLTSSVSSSQEGSVFVTNVSDIPVSYSVNTEATTEVTADFSSIRKYALNDKYTFTYEEHSKRIDAVFDFDDILKEEFIDCVKSETEGKHYYLHEGDIPDEYRILYTVTINDHNELQKITVADYEVLDNSYLKEYCCIIISEPGKEDKCLRSSVISNCFEDFVYKVDPRYQFITSKEDFDMITDESKFECDDRLRFYDYSLTGRDYFGDVSYEELSDELKEIIYNYLYTHELRSMAHGYGQALDTDYECRAFSLYFSPLEKQSSPGGGRWLTFLKNRKFIAIGNNMAGSSSTMYVVEDADELKPLYDFYEKHLREVEYIGLSSAE